MPSLDTPKCPYGCAGGSRDQGEVMEGDAEAVLVRGLGGDVVVATAEVLHEGVSQRRGPAQSGDVSGQRTGRSRAFSRPWSASMGLFACRSSGMQRRGHQLVLYSRVDGRTVGGDLGRNGTDSQRPGEEAPGGGQVAPGRQQDAGDLAMLVDGPVKGKPAARRPSGMSRRRTSGRREHGGTAWPPRWTRK